MNRPILTLPCKQNPDTLEKTGPDYHCNSCDKVLKDFRGKTRPEIIHQIAQSPDTICGIIHREQIDYKHSSLVIPRYQSRIGLSLLGILGLLGPILSSCEEHPKTPEFQLKQHAFEVLRFPMMLKGVLTDHHSLDPLIHSEIQLIQNGKVIRTEKTDENGVFEIQIREKDLTNETFELAYHSPKHFSDTLSEKITSVRNSELRLHLYAMPEPIKVKPKKDDSSSPFPFPEVMIGSLADPAGIPVQTRANPSLHFDTETQPTGTNGDKISIKKG